MKKTTIQLVFLLLLPVVIAALVSCAQTTSMAAKHPAETPLLPLCGDCHEDGRSAMNHTVDFSNRHKFYASQNRRTCEVCHADSFCSDCHAHNDELKPGEKNTDSPSRSLPHRGDYLNQHKIDGRINPAACFPCHGRQNNERCAACHR